MATQPQRRAHRTGFALLAALVATTTLAACASTVPMAGRYTVGGTAGGPSAQGDATLSGAAPIGAGSTGTGTGVSGGAPSSSGSSASALGGQQGATSPLPASAQGAYARGVTAKTIKIGVLYPTGFDKTASTLGFGGATTGDVKAETQAIINSINQAGGVAGRQLVPVWVEFKTLNTSGTDQTPAMCAQMTQDNKVFAVMSVIDMTDELLACFKKNNLPLVDDAAGVSEFQARGAYVIDAGEPRSERLYVGVLSAMSRRGFLTSASKIGLLWPDTPESNRLVNSTVKPLLKNAGLNVVSTFVTPQDSSQQSSYSNAVLQFERAGVDRVIPVGESPLFFMQDAENQQYVPGYVLNSSYGPGALLQTVIRPQELKYAVGAGWQPYADVDAAHNPGPVSTNETRCFKIMQAAGQASSSTLTKALQVQMCDAFFVFQAALSAPSAAVTIPGLVNGILGLGTSYLSAATFSTSFKNRLDGPAELREFSYVTSPDGSSGYFQYDRPVEPFA